MKVVNNIKVAWKRNGKSAFVNDIAFVVGVAAVHVIVCQQTYQILV